MEIIRKGGCQCGAVRFEAHGPPRFVSNCHCKDCRKATGAAFSTWVGYDSARVQWQAERAIFESSPSVKRGYCAACGTPLSYSGRQWAAETHLLIGTFDDPGGLEPGEDTFAGERLPWVKPRGA